MFQASAKESVMIEVRSESLQSLVAAVDKVMASANALIELAQAITDPEGRAVVLKMARELVEVGGQLQANLSDPKQLLRIFGRAFEIADQLARLAGRVAEPDARNRLIAESQRLIESAGAFDRGMRQGAQARGVNIRA